MKNLIVALTTFTALTALSALTAHATDLNVEITLPANKQGTVMAALFDTTEGFPRGKPLQIAMAPPAGGMAVLRFTGLPEGALWPATGSARPDCSCIGPFPLWSIPALAQT